MKPKFLYVIECAPDLLKVGCSNQPEVRASQIWRESPDYPEIEDYTLLASIPGSFSDEKVLHDQLERFRHWGEWYLDSGETREALRAVGFDISPSDRPLVRIPEPRWKRARRDKVARSLKNWKV